MTNGLVDRLGVVVVHFHHENEAARLVGQLVAMRVPVSNIVIADNGSGEGSLARSFELHGVSPGVRTFRNVGYAAAVNDCVSHLPDELDTVLVLTHEVVLASDCVDKLLACLDRRPGTGLVGPVLLDLQDPATVWSAGGMSYPVLRVPYHRAHGRRLGGVALRQPKCEWLDGAVLMLRRSTWEQLGGLDERYFLYHEDVDLGWSVSALGLDVQIVPDARAWQSSGGHLNAFLSTRNVTLLLAKHHRVAWGLWVLLAAARVAVGFIRLGPSAVRDRRAGLCDGLHHVSGRPPTAHWP